MNKEKGYIALFSTIILVAVFLLLFIGMFNLAVGGMTRISEREKSIYATLLASSCIEEALNMIRRDTDYLIENVTIGGDNYCEIGGVERYSSSIIFTSTGIYEDYRKDVEVMASIEEVDEIRTITIVDWNELI